MDTYRHSYWALLIWIWYLIIYLIWTETIIFIKCYTHYAYICCKCSKYSSLVPRLCATISTVSPPADCAPPYRFHADCYTQAALAAGDPVTIISMDAEKGQSCSKKYLLCTLGFPEIFRENSIVYSLEGVRMLWGFTPFGVPSVGFSLKWLHKKYN